LKAYTGEYYIMGNHMKAEDTGEQLTVKRKSLMMKAKEENDVACCC
jgi:hypothetical protein